MFKGGSSVKTIGILGGMSWESTAVYYQLLNEGVRQRLGGLHSAKCLLLSVDFAEIEAMQKFGEWDKAGDTLATAAQQLERGGADVIVLATNTMHKVADAIKKTVSVPFLHIGDTTADAILAKGVRRVALLGTRYTMEQPFLRDHLVARGLDVVVPDHEDILEINRVIYEELCLGIVKQESKEKYIDVISRLQSKGVEGVILGCTEIMLLLKPEDISIASFDSTSIHVDAAIEFALQG
jgi:aspartate racemase